MWIAIIAAVIALLIFFFSKKVNNITKRKNELGAQDCITSYHMEGLPLSKGTGVMLYSGKDNLVIETLDKKVFEIPNKRITNFAALDETKIMQVSKNVVGRAAVGGLLLGGLGAIVGGMSGVGTKDKKTKHSYFVVNYTDKSGNIAIVSFENNVNNLELFVEKFTKTVNLSKGITEAEIKGPITL